MAFTVSAEASSNPAASHLGKPCQLVEDEPHILQGGCIGAHFFSSLDQGRHDLEQVADDSIVGDLKYRRLFVLVDRHDDPLSFIPRQVRIAPRDAEPRRRGPAHDLPVCPTASRRHEPGIDAAREAPIAAPSRSASGLQYLVKFSPDAMPRPRSDDLRAVSSGASDFEPRARRMKTAAVGRRGQPLHLRCRPLPPRIEWRWCAP